MIDNSRRGASNCDRCLSRVTYAEFANKCDELKKEISDLKKKVSELEINKQSWWKGLKRR